MSDELSWYLEPPESSTGRSVPTGPAYRPPATGQDPLAIAAVATGGFPLCPPLGIAFGALALHRLRRSGRRGLGLARAGLVGGIAWSVLFVVVAAFLLWRRHALAAGRDPAGHLIRAGRVSTADIRPGDCLLIAGRAGAERWVPAVPCSSSHTGEVYDVRALGGGPYPGTDAIRSAGSSECAVAWHDGTGATTRAAAGGAAASLAVLVPTAEGWAAGDRGLVCLLATAPRTGAIAAQ